VSDPTANQHAACRDVSESQTSHIDQYLDATRTIAAGLDGIDMTDGAPYCLKASVVVGAMTLAYAGRWDALALVMQNPLLVGSARVRKQHLSSLILKAPAHADAGWLRCARILSTWSAGALKVEETALVVADPNADPDLSAALLRACWSSPCFIVDVLDGMRSNGGDVTASLECFIAAATKAMAPVKSESRRKSVYESLNKYDGAWCLLWNFVVPTSDAGIPDYSWSHKNSHDVIFLADGLIRLRNAFRPFKDFLPTQEEREAECRARTLALALSARSGYWPGLYGYSLSQSSELPFTGDQLFDAAKLKLTLANGALSDPDLFREMTAIRESARTMSALQSSRDGGARVKAKPAAPDVVANRARL